MGRAHLAGGLARRAVPQAAPAEQTRRLNGRLRRAE